MSAFSHPYGVLETVESSTHPGKFYEVRKSHQDGKTYCNCPGWIFKARKGDGICKHIAAYLAKGHKVVVYKLEEFLAVKRARPILYDISGNVERSLAPRRNKLQEGGLCS